MTREERSMPSNMFFAIYLNWGRVKERRREEVREKEKVQKVKEKREEKTKGKKTHTNNNCFKMRKARREKIKKVEQKRSTSHAFKLGKF